MIQTTRETKTTSVYSAHLLYVIWQLYLIKHGRCLHRFN